MVRLAGLPEGVLRLANSGIYFATGSDTVSFPSSWSMRMAAPVMGFVIEAIQKSDSGVSGRFEAASARPVDSRWRTLSPPTTTVTAPAISFFEIISCIASPTPGSFGGSAIPTDATNRQVQDTSAAAKWRRRIHLKIIDLRISSNSQVFSSVFLVRLFHPRDLCLQGVSD